MARKPTRIRTTLAASLLALTLIAPWAIGQDAVVELRRRAEQGSAEAQYNLGAMYAYGEGVSKDSMHAHKWFNIAGANGNEQVRTIRDSVEYDMTRDEIRRATELARKCMASNYQDCEP